MRLDDNSKVFRIFLFLNLEEQMLLIFSTGPRNAF